MFPVIPKGSAKKSCRTPKSLQKPGQSKFKRMKQRLQLKVSVNGPEEDILDAEPLSMEAPPQEEDEVPLNHEDQAPNEDQVAQGTKKLSKKNNKELFNRSSPMRIVRLCKFMTEDQKKIIADADFGDITNMKCSKLFPELCRFLMKAFNPDTCELDFGDRGRIPVNIESVVNVMGVPMGDTPVAYHLDIDATSLVLDMFGIKDGKQPTLAYVEKELGPQHPPNQMFLRKFMIYLVCSMFAPTTGIAVSPRCYPSLINTEAIRSLNWPKFIIDILIQTARAKDKKNWFKACMPYLMVRYVDSLETNAVAVPEDGTRICVWTNKLVSLAVDLDTNSDGSFGKLPLKQCYRKLSLFSTNPSVLDMFIKTHARGDHSDENLAKFRGALTEMCIVFEDGLAQFIKNLSSNDSKGSELHQEQHHVKKSSGRKRGKKNRHSIQITAQDVGDAEEAATEDAEKVEVEMKQQKKQLQSHETEAGDAHAEIDAEKIEALASAMVQKGNKRKSSDDGFRAEFSSPKMAKLTEVTKMESVETLQENTTSNEEAVLVGNEKTPEYDMDTGTFQTASTCANLSHFSHGDGSTKEASAGKAQGIDPLKILQLYGTGSQSSADSSGEDALVSKLSPAASVTIFGEHLGEQSISTRELRSTTKKSSVKCNKRVTFVDQGNEDLGQIAKTTSEACIVPVEPSSNRINVESSPTARKPVTRSMSPAKRTSPRNKENVPITGINSPSQRRPTRFATAEARANRNSMGQTTPPVAKNSMSRNLEPEFVNTETQAETLEQKRRREILESYPSFDLGFGTPTEKDNPAEKKHTEGVEPLLVISSNEDSGDSLDKIYSALEMPVRTPVSHKVTHVHESISSPPAPNSYTPVPQAHQRRVVKPVAAQKSPFVHQKKLVASKQTCELYNKICSYGGKSEDVKNKEKIVDYGDWFIYLRDFADSIRPTGWLSNSVCEVALYVLSKEMAQQKKCVFPLTLATKLRSPTCFHDRVVQKAFEFSSTNRLDHKEQIMFSVLQNLSTSIKTFTGHYYLIVLNLKAERFEVMDSMRSKGNQSLMTDSAAIIGSIKYMWALKYHESRFDISKFRTIFIDTPMQTTTCDCGYFMLKYIELWDGRRMVQPFSQTDLPNIRKLFAKKMVDCDENQVIWQELLFKN